MKHGLSYMFAVLILVIVAQIIGCSDNAITNAIISVGFMNVLFAVESKSNK